MTSQVPHAHSHKERERDREKIGVWEQDYHIPPFTGTHTHTHSPTTNMHVQGTHMYSCMYRHVLMYILSLMYMYKQQKTCSHEQGTHNALLVRAPYQCIPVLLRMAISGMRQPSALMWFERLSREEVPSTKPMRQARCSGVLPSRSQTKGLALALSRYWMTLCWRVSTARCSGDWARGGRGGGGTWIRLQSNRHCSLRHMFTYSTLHDTWTNLQ